LLLVAKAVIFELQVTVGGVLSTTLTVKLQLTLELLTVQTTLLLPRRKPLPLGGTQITGSGPAELVAMTL
jgi:hypothetical protein